MTVVGRVDADMLREGLDAVIERHEAWRTVFASRGGVPTQVVLADAPCGWSVADLDGAAEAEQEAAARRLAEHLVAQPFDLAGGPLVRALLVRLSAQRHRLFITWHRIVADRVSVMWVMLPELAELYEARTRGQAGELSVVGEQYADYALRQRQQPPEVLQSGPGSWSEHLAGAPAVLELPADRRRAGQPGWRTQAQSFALGAGLTSRLRGLSHREQVSLRATLTAAFVTHCCTATRGRKTC